MPPRDIPLTIEKRRIQINAFGIRSDKVCETDNYDCCETGTGTSGIAEEMCCPDNALARSLDATVIGPLGDSGASCIIDLTLTLIPSSFSWNGEARETVAACNGVEVYLRLWCIKDEFANLYWMTSGTFNTSEGDRQNFGPEPLEDFGDGTLTTILDIPGYATGLEIAIQKPCLTGGEVPRCDQGPGNGTIPGTPGLLVTPSGCPACNSSQTLAPEAQFYGSNPVEWANRLFDPCGTHGAFAIELYVYCFSGSWTMFTIGSYATSGTSPTTVTAESDSTTTPFVLHFRVPYVWISDGPWTGVPSEYCDINVTVI